MLSTKCFRIKIFNFISSFAVRAVDRPRPWANACAFGAGCMSCQWSVEVGETKIFFRLRDCVFMTCAWSSVSVRRTCSPCKAVLLSRRQFFVFRPQECILLLPKLPFSVSACPVAVISDDIAHDSPGCSYLSYML